jgi:hypothetical protein
MASHDARSCGPADRPALWLVSGGRVAAQLVLELTNPMAEVLDSLDLTPAAWVAIIRAAKAL